MNPTAHDVTAEDGTRLRVWEDATDETIDAEEAVLFLHGGMTHSRALFAPPVEGDDSYSWLRAATAAGRAAYALDVRGYGESEFPPEMDEPPEENDPPVLAEDAAVDVAAAFAFVADRHETVHVVGVSWGTMTGGVFFAENDPDAASFTMCAPVYDPTYEFEAGVAALGLDTDLNAYFVDDRETVEARQDGEENPVFEAVWTAMVESGQGLGDRDAYVAQTGAVADVGRCCDGAPPYNAAHIDVPSLVVRGSEDGTSQRSDALAVYDELGSTDDYKEYAEVAGGDHFVMHGERRQTLYTLVSAFQDRV